MAGSDIKLVLPSTTLTRANSNLGHIYKLHLKTNKGFLNAAAPALISSSIPAAHSQHEF